MGNEMHWISKNGGPFLLLDRSLLMNWSGADLDLNLDDYDRACDVEDFLGTVAVGEGQGLVLAGPFSTTYLPLGEDRGILVRIDYTPDRLSIERHLHEIRRTETPGVRDVQITFRTTDPILFDAAYPGDEVAMNNPIVMKETLRICLVDGTYDVYTKEFSPDPEIGLILHHLKRTDG